MKRRLFCALTALVVLYILSQAAPPDLTAASRELGIALRPHCANPALRRRFVDCARRVVREMTGENDANATDISAPSGV